LFAAATSAFGHSNLSRTYGLGASHTRVKEERIALLTVKATGFFMMAYRSYARPPVLQMYPAQHDTIYPHAYTTDASVSAQAYTENQQQNLEASPIREEPPSEQVIDTPRPTPAQPMDNKPTVGTHISQTSSASDTDSGPPLKPHLLSQRNDFLLDWTLKILGVASAILFGVWAPISYKITADGNAGNDAAQASLMSEIISLRKQAATAASEQHSAQQSAASLQESAVTEQKTAQQSAASAISKLQGQIDNVGLLWAWQFCSDKTSAAVCADLISSATLAEALSSLGGLTSSRTSNAAPTTSAPRTLYTSTVTSEIAGLPSTAPTDPAASEPASSSGASSSTIFTIVLAVVFGTIAVVGFVVGVLVFKNRQGKKKAGHEKGPHPRSTFGR
jgi:hypothetical protein